MRPHTTDALPAATRRALRQASKRLALVFGLPCLVLWASVVKAQESSAAGLVTYLSGTVTVKRADGAIRTLRQGDAVYPLDRLVTGVGAHAHIRTRDDGLLALRPDTQARIEIFEFDPSRPEASRIRLVLESGVIRAVSGIGAQAARDRFRLNTPVAAVGIRGTDFTVSATAQVTRVVVQAGAVVISPFGPDCLAEALGPCSNQFARVLTGEQAGKLLELRRGDQEPRLLEARPGATSGAAPVSPSGKPAEGVAAKESPRASTLQSGPSGVSTQPAPPVGPGASGSATTSPGASPSTAAAVGAPAVGPAGSAGSSASSTMPVASAVVAAPAVPAPAAGSAAQVVSPLPTVSAASTGLSGGIAPSGLSANTLSGSSASTGSTELVSVAAAVPPAERLPNPAQAPLTGQVINLASEARNREVLNLTVALVAAADPVPTAGEQTATVSGSSTSTSTNVGAGAGSANPTTSSGSNTQATPAPPPATSLASTVPAPLVQPLPEPVVTWGRWAPFAGAAGPAADTTAFKATYGPFVGMNEAYVLSVASGTNVRMPEAGQFAFKLNAAEAFETRDNAISAPASVTRGELSVNFGTRSFVTNLDVKLSDTSLVLRSEGRITNSGGLDGFVLYALPGLNMSVKGQLGGQLANRAGYIFTATVGGSGRGVVGATSWGR